MTGGRTTTAAPAEGERYELPEGWMRVKLSDVVSVGSTQILPKRTPEQSFNYLALEHIETGTGRVLSNLSPTLGRNIGSNKFTFEAGDVLYGKLRPYLRKVTVAEFDGVSATDLIPLRALGAVEPHYLQRYLLSPQALDYVHPLMAGIKMPRLRSGDLHAMPIPLAPLPEQRRIVERIEALFQQSHTARQALDRIPPLLKKFRQSVLAAAFRGDLTRDWREQNPDIEPASALLDRIRAERRRKWGEALRADSNARRKRERERSELIAESGLPQLPQGWIRCTLQECASLITKGESPNWQGYQYVADGVPFIRSENVLWGTLDIANVEGIPQRFHQKLRRSHIRPNDVLINLVGASIGRCAIVPPELREANVNQAVATIRTNEALSPLYLLYLLLSPSMQTVIQGKKVEVARPNISLGDLSGLIVPLAPFAEQRQIFSTVDKLFAEATSVEVEVEATRRRADTLDQSILARAFRGELVPQDPNDEPASVVLERARAGMNRSAADQRGRGRIQRRS